MYGGKVMHKFKRQTIAQSYEFPVKNDKS